MRNKLIFSLLAVGILLALSGSAFAHHGAAAYDASKPVTLTGTVTDFQFVNPHVIIAMDVKDPSTGKTVQWQGEMTSPNRLARAGWTKSTLKVGDEVTMTGSPLRSGSPMMAIRKIAKNGQDLSTDMSDN
jgi:hypothetical protein